MNSKILWTGLVAVVLSAVVLIKRVVIRRAPPIGWGNGGMYELMCFVLKVWSYVLGVKM